MNLIAASALSLWKTLDMQERANRYEIVRPVEYRFRSPQGPIVGSGRTVNISRTGVLLQTTHDLEVGRRIELVIRMSPATIFGGSTEIKLMLEGSTVRSQDGYVGVATKKHKLRREE